MFLISIQESDFDLQKELLLAHEHAETSGGLVFFVGKVRQNKIAPFLDHLEIEHFPELTEEEISRMIQKTSELWPLDYVRLIHRIGKRGINDNIVLLLTASPHRQAAYDASQYMMNYLKQEAPLWKKEVYTDGQSLWVASEYSGQ